MARQTAAAPSKRNVPAARRSSSPVPVTPPGVGFGFDETDSESFAVPFLVMLQKNSPQADPDDPAYIKGAKAGMFMNTVTQEMFSEVELIPCFFQRRFNRWAARDAGGGFKGMIMPSAIPELEASGKIAQSEEGGWFYPLPDGTINEKKCDRLNDTRLHYCLQVLPNGALTEVLVTLSRTQVKASRRWMSMMKTRGGNMFGTVYVATPKKEENDKGTWMGWEFEVSRDAESEETNAGMAFYSSVKGGRVTVKMDALREGATDRDNGFESERPGR